MPKYGIHHIVLKEAANKLLASKEAETMRAANIIQADLSSAIIGSIGPDLFFWGRDYKLVDLLYRLYQNIDKVVGLYNEIVQPLQKAINAVGEPVEEKIESLAPATVKMIKQVLQEVEETSKLYQSAISTGIFAGVLDGADILTNAADIPSLSQTFFQELFIPKLQYNRKESEWYWFDMLHYRKTGTFARNLVKQASNSTQKAFAFGYLSHIATDVTGHPFVNQVVGTTFRLDAQRHVIAENFMDTWKFYKYYDESINQKLFSRLNLPKALPSEIGDLLFSTFYSTYDGVNHPLLLSGDGFYTREQIDQSYEVFYKVLKFLENQAVQCPEEPFPDALIILSEFFEAIRPPSPPATGSLCDAEDIFSFGTTKRSRDCYKKFFENLGKWHDYMKELLAWSIEALFHLIDFLLSQLLSLPINVLLAILYGIQLLCYEIYCNSRSVLVMNGFVFPEPYEVDSAIGRNLITPYQCATLNFKNFPSVGEPVNNLLMCPISKPEEPTTAAGFHPATIDTTPDRFIYLEPFNEESVRRYALSTSPEKTRQLEQKKLSIGNATDFTAWMIEHAKDDEIAHIVYADWNLDADRGYGYKTWSGTVPNNDPYVVEKEEYLGIPPVV